METNIKKEQIINAHVHLQSIICVIFRSWQIAFLCGCTFINDILWKHSRKYDANGHKTTVNNWMSKRSFSKVWIYVCETTFENWILNWTKETWTNHKAQSEKRNIMQFTSMNHMILLKIVSSLLHGLLGNDVIKFMYMNKAVSKHLKI